MKHEELFTDVQFDSLNLYPHLVACLQQRFSVTGTTKVQSMSIPILLAGRDALIKSATGSGKTFAYAVPMVHSLQALEPKINRSSGLQALIILPTRELALQTFDCLNELLNPFRRIVLGMLTGGERKKSEKARIRKGLNILIATPGRLLDHLEHTKNLKLDSLRWLVIDEADRLYEQGFSAMVGQIIEHLHRSIFEWKHVQTALLSATLSEGVRELAGLSLKNPAIIDVADSETETDKTKMDSLILPASLENCYTLVAPKLRLVTLACILIDELIGHPEKNNSKVIVFMSCQDVVDFYSTLLNEVLPKLLPPNKRDQLKILQLRGNMSQVDRTQVFKRFHALERGVLFCTDVASRGLDLPNIDLVVQTSVPALVEDYVHRVGRTARVGIAGRSILFILPSEARYLPYLQEQISLNFRAIQPNDLYAKADLLQLDNRNLNTVQERVAYLQHRLEDAVEHDGQLKTMAIKAYQAHLRAYASYPAKLSSEQGVHIRHLHLGHVAKSFALRESPSELSAKVNALRRQQKAAGAGKFTKGGVGKRRGKIQDNATQRRRTIVPIEERVSEFGGEPVLHRMKAKKLKGTKFN